MAQGRNSAPVTLLVTDFRANPATLFTSPNIAATVASLIAADPTSLSLVLGLVGSGNPAQQTAIANGLAQAAATASAAGNLTLASEIQRGVANVGNALFLAAYSGAAGDSPTGAGGGGGGGGAGGGGGGGSGGPIADNSARGGGNGGNNTPGSSNGYPNNAFGQTTASVASSGAAGGGSQNSVSPGGGR